jgi:hydroxypyruvate isomerase
MKLSVCVDAVFAGCGFLEGMRKTKECGIEAFEFWSWWDKDIAAIQKAKEALELETAAFCTKFISLTESVRRKEYIQALTETIDVATRLGCSTIITQIGNEIPGVPREKQHDSIVSGLAQCVQLLSDTGMTLVFEPLNTIVDHPGYYLSSSAEAFVIAKEVGSDHVKVLYDIYHQQLMEGNLTNTILSSIGRIGHFHCAGAPGRHELDYGEINYTEIVNAIHRSSYSGFIGLEYFPASDPEGGLKSLVKQYSRL